MCRQTDIDTEFRHLAPSEIEISRDGGNKLRLRTVGGDTFDAVKPVRAFPLTSPDNCVFLMDAEGSEIGLIPDVKQLEEKSRRILEEELSQEYFVTRVDAIKSVKSRHGVTTWGLITERGDRTIHVKDRTDIRKLPGRRVLFTDVEGMRYEVPNAEQLDNRSQNLLDSET
ncbi:MAG: DUF1854 domain-containing protein [Chitinivibrionales bacterium]|nr:DUF1854 domain-containing protein [Chitinivibrionales bacterium]